MVLIRVERWREDRHSHCKYCWRCRNCARMQYERT
jgi:hypothetical protein